MKLIKQTTKLEETLYKKMKKKLIDSKYDSFQQLNVELITKWVSEK